MTLEEFNYIAEIIASIAVIATLLYVGMQIKQNTRSTRLETIRDISSGFNSFYDTMASNRELTDIWHRGAFNYQGLDETEKLRFTFAVVRVFRLEQEQFLQWREGALDDDHWQSLSAQYTDAVQLPGWQEVWSRRKHHYTKGFQDYVGKLIAEGEGAKPLYDPPPA